jgi:hypothetical protein
VPHGNWHASCKALGKPANGRTHTPVQGIAPMTTSFSNLRNAVAAVAFSLVAGTLMLASLVGPTTLA